jgi:hypothetical protein
MFKMLKGFAGGMLLLFIAWVPIIIVGTSEAWGPAVLGPDAYQALMANHAPWVVAIIFAAVVFLGGMFIILRPLFGVLKNVGGGGSQLLQTGKSARAKVLSLGESGAGIVTVNDQPLLSLTLEVSDGYGTPYQVAIETIVPRYAIPQVQPGSIIAVRVDPLNPQNIAIEWGVLPPGT